MTDIQHTNAPFTLNEVEHRYGPNVHILSDPVTRTHLARLCSRSTGQPHINGLIRLLYHRLLHEVAASEFPKAPTSVETRMIEVTDRGVWSGDVIDPKTPVVVASMARAGILPGQLCFDALTELLDGNVVRHDYFGVGRVVDQDQKVTGAAVTYSKVGGPFEDAILIIPDPMGATGGSMIETIRTYEKEVPDRPSKTIAMHLIVTPEYVRRMRRELPDLVIYTTRLDRGMSDPDVLATIPGTHPDRESGLNEKHYIVPGAGGLGEIMTNAFV
ncbi:MAG: uracil phosphoribosyltransferase [Deltaproteobacteria bacterium]|nr:uracil phosphoribosyltransferase [Deltaproteobacteria bacterium]